MPQPELHPALRSLAARLLRGRRAADGMRAESGQAQVEFALTLPALMVIVLGFMTVAIGMNNFIVMTQATSVAVHQVAIMRNGASTDPCNVASTAMAGAVPSLRQASLAYTVTIGGSAFTGTSCSGATSGMVQGQTVMLAVTYPCNIWAYKYKYLSACMLHGQAQEPIQ